jgi:hypothetical protein
MSLYGTRNQGLNLRRGYGQAAAGASALTQAGAALPQLNRMNEQVNASRAQKAADQLQFSKHYEAQKAVRDQQQEDQSLRLEAQRDAWGRARDARNDERDWRNDEREAGRDQFNQYLGMANLSLSREGQQRLAGQDQWNRTKDNANYALALDNQARTRAQDEREAEQDRINTGLQYGARYTPESYQGFADSGYQNFGALQLREPTPRGKRAPVGGPAYWRQVAKQQGLDISGFLQMEDGNLKVDEKGDPFPTEQGNAYAGAIKQYWARNQDATPEDAARWAYNFATGQNAQPAAGLNLPAAAPNPTPVQTPPQAGPLPPSYQMRQTTGTQGLNLPTTNTQAAAPAPPSNAPRGPADQFADQYRAQQAADDWSQMDDRQIADSLAGEGYTPAQIKAVLAEVSRQRSRM